MRWRVRHSASKSGSLCTDSGAIHSVAPTRYEIQISSNDMSNATENPWYTRSSSRTPRTSFSLRRKWQMLR